MRVGQPGDLRPAGVHQEMPLAVVVLLGVDARGPGPGGASARRSGAAAPRSARRARVVSIDRNGPPVSVFGLGSQVSSWLAPPASQITRTCFCFRASSAETDGEGQPREARRRGPPPPPRLRGTTAARPCGPPSRRRKCISCRGLRGWWISARLSGGSGIPSRPAGPRPGPGCPAGVDRGVRPGIGRPPDAPRPSAVARAGSDRAPRRRPTGRRARRGGRSGCSPRGPARPGSAGRWSGRGPGATVVSSPSCGWPATPPNCATNGATLPARRLEDGRLEEALPEPPPLGVGLEDGAELGVVGLEPVHGRLASGGDVTGGLHHAPGQLLGRERPQRGDREPRGLAELRARPGGGSLERW